MPSNSHQWLDEIMERLFAPETRRIDKMVESLTERNSKILGRPTHGFMHMGKLYVPKSAEAIFRMNRKIAVPSISIELIDEISAFNTDINKINRDKDKIRQVLFKLIYQANSKQEIRDALPECVVQIIEEFRGMPRTMVDCTWLIRNDWRSMRDYEKVLPKIEFYAMTALIY